MVKVAPSSAFADTDWLERLKYTSNRRIFESIRPVFRLKKPIDRSIIPDMKVRKITMSDACEATGYTRDQLRGMLRDLPEFVSNPSAGKNRQFSRVEFVALCVITRLESRYGMRRSVIGLLLDQLLAALNGLRAAQPNATLNILVSPPAVKFVGDDGFPFEGLLVPLAPIFSSVDSYLGAHENHEPELPFGPVPVSLYKHVK